jgi:signal transduction histidine kinase
MYKTNSFVILLLLTFLLNVLTVKSQAHEIDSLENLLSHHAEEDTIKVNLLNEIAYKLYTKDTDRTLLLAEEASSLAKKLNFTKGEAKSLRLKGIYYNMKANYPLSLEYHQKSLNIYEKLGDKKGISDCLNSLGIVYNDQGSYPQALEYYQKAIKIFEEIDDQISISYCLNNIGVIHYDQGEYSIALDYYQKSLKIDEQFDNKDGTAICLNNIGEIYSDLGEYTLALDYFQKSLKIVEEIGDIYGISYLYKDFGIVYIKTRNYTKALDYTLKSLKIAEEMEFLDIQESTYLQLSKIYAKTNNYKKAYENFALYKEITDNLFNEENIKKITGLEYQYKYEKEKQAVELEQQKKDAINAEKAKRQRIATNSLIAGFVLMILFVLIVLRSFLQKRKINKLLSVKNQSIENKNIQLQEQNEEIQQLNEELSSTNEALYMQKEELENHRNNLEKLVKDRTADLIVAKEKAEESDRLKSSFLANMSHEIRTPMNAIIGFSDLICDPELSDETKEELSTQINNNSDTLLKLIDDIIDIAKIESGQLKINKQQCSVNGIFEKLEPIYNNNLSTSINNIDLLIKSPKKDVDVFTDPLRIQQVLINLIDNAFKFTEEGEVLVGVKSTNNQKGISFFVKDTGIGLTEEKKSIIFKRFTKVEDDRKKLYRGAGLGLAISKNLIDLLGGKIWLESEENIGSTFYFSIPLS